MKRILFSAFLIIASACGGVRYEAAEIQRTCEADTGKTVLNGTTYLCLSQRQIDILRSRSQTNT